MPKVTTSKDKHKEVIPLYKAGHYLLFIAHQTGVRLRTVQCLVKKFKNSSRTTVPAPLPKPGRPCKITHRTCALISHAGSLCFLVTCLEISAQVLWVILQPPRLGKSGRYNGPAIVH